MQKFYPNLLNGFISNRISDVTNIDAHTHCHVSGNLIFDLKK